MPQHDSYSIVLHGLLKNIDTSPENAWVFEDLGDGESYIQKYLRRLDSLDCIKNVYLVTLDRESHHKFKSLRSAKLKLVYAKDSDFSWPENWWGITWNLSQASESVIPTWAYQVMLGFDEEVLIEDYCFGGFWDPDLVLKLIEKVEEDPGSYGAIHGCFSAEVLVTTKDYYKLVFPEKITGMPKEADTVPKERKVQRLYSNREGIRYNFEYEPFFDVYPRLRQGFRVLKDYYSENSESQSQADFRKSIEEFCLENYSKHVIGVPDTLFIQATNGNEYFQLESLKKILQEAAKVKRFTIVFADELFSHPEFNEFLEILKSYNHHYYLRTEGEFDSQKLDILHDVFDVIRFSIPEVDSEKFKSRCPEKNVDLILHNLSKTMYRATESKDVQVGIYCKLPQRDDEKYMITKFWRERLDHIPILNAAYRMAGHLAPKIQFVQYGSPSGIEHEIERDLDLRQWKLLPPGTYESGKSVMDTNFIDLAGLSEYL